MLTLEEINRAAPDTPVFVLHLYDRALLNGAALRAVGYTKDTAAPIGGEIQRDKQGNPTGLLIAADYFSIPEEQIKQLESVLTMIGGKVVFGDKEFSKLALPPLPVSPEWSPVKHYGGYHRTAAKLSNVNAAASYQNPLAQNQVGAQEHRRFVAESGLWSLGVIALDLKPTADLGILNQRLSKERSQSDTVGIHCT